MAQGPSTEIITMIKWIRTIRLSIKNSLSDTFTLCGSGAPNPARPAECYPVDIDIEASTQKTRICKGKQISFRRCGESQEAASFRVLQGAMEILNGFTAATYAEDYCQSKAEMDVICGEITPGGSATEACGGQACYGEAECNTGINPHTHTFTHTHTHSHTHIHTLALQHRPVRLPPSLSHTHTDTHTHSQHGSQPAQLLFEWCWCPLCVLPFDGEHVGFGVRATDLGAVHGQMLTALTSTRGRLLKPRTFVSAARSSPSHHPLNPSWGCIAGLRVSAHSEWALFGRVLRVVHSGRPTCHAISGRGD